jgi:hypothetical protein
MDFYKKPINDWICGNLVKHYSLTMQQSEQKKILENIKKDLGGVALADSQFDVVSRKKAQEILGSWKVSFLACSSPIV